MVAQILPLVRDLTGRGDRGVLATITDGPDAGSAALIAPDGSIVAGVPDLPSAVLEAVEPTLRTKSPTSVDADDATWFVEPVLPAPRMVVLGAIAVADALVPMAAAAGWDVVVIDARDWLATDERYPDATAVHCGPPAEILAGLTLDSSTAVVSFLHDARFEDAVLVQALGSPAAYVGAMGSGRTTGKKLARLAEAGVSEHDLARLHAPIGLDIGAANPREIAVAVLAEIVAATRGADHASKPAEE